MMEGDQMSTVSVRYIVDSVEEAVAFYRDRLGFEVLMFPDPAFAMVTRGDLRLVLASPVPAEHHGGGSRPMPDGTTQGPGGWNRIMLEVADLTETVRQLRGGGARFRNEIVTGVGSAQILLEDPSGNPIELFEPRRRDPSVTA
jgi:catechol 2,3-dioxygenase-like lactoylglutathione lyase family enzyme